MLNSLSVKFSQKLSTAFSSLKKLPLSLSNKSKLWRLTAGSRTPMYGETKGSLQR